MFERLVHAICHSSYRHPGRWLLVTLILSLAGVKEVLKVGLDTDLTRLLPRNSRAVYWSQQLGPKVGGDGGYFSVLFEGQDHERVLHAVTEAAEEIRALNDVQSVQYRYSLDFLNKYRYLLIPSEYLQKIFDAVVRWKDEASPFGLKLEDRGEDKTSTPSEDADVENNFRRYANLSDYHQSVDGKTMGMIVRPRKGITSLGVTTDLFYRLDEIAQRTGKKWEVWAGVGGSLRNKVDEYEQIMSDLNWAGIIAITGIIVVLVITFRSILVLPVLLYPIGLGLIWAYALVPTLVGDLNTITSFLLMVLLGLGEEWSIHLVKRFQGELEALGPERALLETFGSTGRSILTSGFTTSTGLIVLSFSNFRGFSEFGIISASSMLMIFVAMFTVMPPAMVLGYRLGLIKPAQPSTHGLALVPPAWMTWLLVTGVVTAAGLALFGLRFDFDFTSLKADVPRAQEVKERHRKVYQGFSAPSALYVASDLASLDSAQQLLEQQRAAETTPLLSSIASIRSYIPRSEEAAHRLQIIRELQDRLQGRWIRRVKDPDKKRWIEDIRDFVPPDRFPELGDLPEEMKLGMMTRDGSGAFILSVDVVASKNKDGRAAMAFAKELYGVKMPASVLGPTGDKLVLAEILDLVTTEGPKLVLFTFLGIVLLVLLDRHGSPFETFWILVPLIAGIFLTLGIAVALGWKMNFFNMVILPALIGMTVDNGVHSYRRWEELGYDTRAMQAELLEPLTGSAFTTVIGYTGMTLAHHQGLRTIGSLAVLGLLSCWITAVALMPGILSIRERRMKARASRPMPVAQPAQADGTHVPG
jgi:uncharacterized protein